MGCVCKSKSQGRGAAQIIIVRPCCEVVTSPRIPAAWVDLDTGIRKVDGLRKVIMEESRSHMYPDMGPCSGKKCSRTVFALFCGSLDEERIPCRSSMQDCLRCVAMPFSFHGDWGWQGGYVLSSHATFCNPAVGNNGCCICVTLFPSSGIFPTGSVPFTAWVCIGILGTVRACEHMLHMWPPVASHDVHKLFKAQMDHRFKPQPPTPHSPRGADRNAQTQMHI